MTTSLHLPIEVLAAIVRFIDDRPTLAALMSVSSATYDLAARPLYAEIVVTHHKLAGYRVGLLAFRPAPGEALGGYPNTVSDRRKRALLALTTTIRVRSVPSLEEEHPSCPLDKRTFPSASTIHVSAPVPHHRALEARRRSRRRAMGA